MSEYHFYGAESAEIQDSRGLNPKDYYDVLSKDMVCRNLCAKTQVCIRNSGATV